MAIFGGRKNLVQRIQQQKWRTDDERKELLAELRESDPRANDLMPILFHADASVRQAVAELFVKCATPQAVMALARDMGNRASNERTMVGRVFNRLPGELMSPVVDIDSPAGNPVAVSVYGAVPPDTAGASAS